MEMEQGIIEVHRKEQIQVPPTEVYDNHPEIRNIVDEWLIPGIQNHPESVWQLALVGEAGSMKGTVNGQIGQYLSHEPSVNELLEDRGIRLRQHAVSTASLVNTGIVLGLHPSPFGSPTPEELSAITAMGNEALERAEQTLPLLYPDETHLLLEEFAAVDENFDAGTSIIRRQGKSDNAYIIFVASNPQIQERTYAMRRKLWETDVKQKKVLSSYKTTMDMEGDGLKTTMGTSRSIELLTDVVNHAMYESFRKGEFHLPFHGPNKVTGELLLADNPHKMDEDELEIFFDNLTDFSSGKMITHPLRPYLQVGYYEHLAKKWKLKNTQVILPTFIDADIHCYPNYLGSNELDLQEFTQDHTLPLVSDIFPNEASGMTQ